MAETEFDEANEAKVSMDHIYDQCDPRAYFRELEKVDYAIPDSARRLISRLLPEREKVPGGKTTILDIGCSYGINAALLKYGLTMSELYEHWTDPELDEASVADVIEHEQRFLAGLDAQENIEMIGLDQAEKAVRYAEKVGLLDEGVALNLEEEPLPATAAEQLAPVDLVMSTGCVGYVTETSFDKLIPAVTSDRKPWFANFVLRMFPFDAIATTLQGSGYVTEKLEGRTFVQRRFASAVEQEQVLDQLEVLGVDPSGKETEGHLLAEFFVSRPRGDAARLSLGELLAA